MKKEMLFKRLQLIHEYCKMRGDLDDFAATMEEMIIKANACLGKGSNKKLLEYNNYFDEIIEDDTKADLFLMGKLGIEGTTKKRRQKMLKEVILRKEILNDDEYYLIKAKIDEESVTNTLKGKASISLIEKLNSLVLKYENSDKPS